MISKTSSFSWDVFVNTARLVSMAKILNGTKRVGLPV